MLKPGRLQRLLSFVLKPLLLALFVSLIFHWTNAKTSPAKRPKQRHPHISKSIVVASSIKSNTSWLAPAASSSDWKVYNYVADDPNAALTVPINKGNEAMVYLSYIIDNYFRLPDVVFFHHHHSQAWHQQFSSSFELANLNVATVLKHGYLSPRCLPGCENVIQLSGVVAPVNDLKGADRDVQLSSILHEFLDRGKPVPEKLAAPCCAQFAVSREALHRREREWWARLRKWLMETELDSRTSGRILEYTWHVWFGMDPVFCPSENQCLCDVYGIGNCESEL